MAGKSTYYNSIEQQQSTAIDSRTLALSINSDEPLGESDMGTNSLAFNNILYTVSTGWAWKKSNKVILNSVR